MKWTPELILQRIKTNPYMAEDAGFMEAMEACIKDAERYRFLRSMLNMTDEQKHRATEAMLSVFGEDEEGNPTNDEFDASVDAAISQEAKG